ncbi:unnamed protein product, partial [Tenebrio molitor]
MCIIIFWVYFPLFLPMHYNILDHRSVQFLSGVLLKKFLEFG